MRTLRPCLHTPGHVYVFLFPPLQCFAPQVLSDTPDRNDSKSLQKRKTAFIPPGPGMWKHKSKLLQAQVIEELKATEAACMFRGTTQAPT